MPQKRKLPEHILRDTELSEVAIGDDAECIEEDNQLWLIRVPKDLDITLLNGVKIHVAEMKAEQPQILAGDEKLEVTVSQTVLPSSSILTPTSEPGRLACRPRPSGEMKLKKVVDVAGGEVKRPSQRKESTETDNKVIFPSGLKQRWKPIGWRTPFTSIKGRTKTPKRKRRKVTE